MLKKFGAVVNLKISNSLRKARRSWSACIGFSLMSLRRLANQKRGGFRQKPSVIVLSLGGDGSSSNTAKAAKKLGFSVNVFCKDFPSNESRFADKWFKVDCLDEFSKATSAALNIEPAPEAVLIEGQHILLPMQRHLATSLGVRAATEKSVFTSTSKISMRKALSDRKVCQPWWTTVEDQDLASLSYPLVIKPEIGTASRGVRTIHSESELVAAVNEHIRTSPDRKVGGNILLEQYTEGKQYDVEGVAFDGVFYPLVIVEEMYESMPPFFPPSWFLFNPPMDSVKRQLLVDSVSDALEALDVKYGAFHCELRLDKKNNGMIIDYANRMGYNNLVSKACGVSFPEQYVLSMVDSNFSEPCIEEKVLFCHYLRDEGECRKYKKLVRESQESVLHSSFFPFMQSSVLTLGVVTLVADDYQSLVKLLLHYEIFPQNLDMASFSKKPSFDGLISESNSPLT